MSSAPVVVIAPDKFKGSLSAQQVAAALAAGVLSALPDAECVLVPMADGGDGTIDALIAAGWQAKTVESVSALGNLVQARAARKDGVLAVELANVCGIAGLGEVRDPWRASTRGLGTAIRSLLDDDVDEVIVAVGGSASTDGGAGLLAGLGFALLDAVGSPVEDGLGGLPAVERIEAPDDMTALSALRWTALCDVDAPMLGPDGAAYVFGPQKGLRSVDLDVADDALAHWDAVLTSFTGRSVGYVVSAGAAGGTAAALMAVFDADVRAGAEFIADVVGLREQVIGADLVITGEGRFDATSSSGKAPSLVIDVATTYGVPVVAVAGDVGSGAPPVDEVVALPELMRDGEDTFSDARALLQRAGAQIGRNVTSLAGD